MRHRTGCNLPFSAFCPVFRVAPFSAFGTGTTGACLTPGTLTDDAEVGVVNGGSGSNGFFATITNRDVLDRLQGRKPAETVLGL